MSFNVNVNVNLKQKEPNADQSNNECTEMNVF